MGHCPDRRLHDQSSMATSSASRVRVRRSFFFIIQFFLLLPFRPDVGYGANLVFLCGVFFAKYSLKSGKGPGDSLINPKFRILPTAGPPSAQEILLTATEVSSIRLHSSWSPPSMALAKGVGTPPPPDGPAAVEVEMLLSRPSFGWKVTPPHQLAVDFCKNIAPSYLG